VATTDVPPSDTKLSDSPRQLTTGTLVAAALGVCLAQVALAIPAVLNGLFQQDLGTTSSQLTWISDAFLVPVTLLELTFGVLGDLFGRKRLLVGGALLLAVGELIAVLTPGSSSSTGTRVLVLWTGQIIAGIGAAALFPTTLAMVAAGTHTARHRARGITVWAASLSAGGLVSPVLGGLSAKNKFGSDEFASWRWAFIAVLILALISATVSALLAQNSSAPAGRSLDWPGQITIAVALFALLFAVIQGPTSGWASGQVIGGFIVGAVFLVLFVLAENRAEAPLLRLGLFANRAFTIAAIVTVVGMFSFLGTAYATSIRLSAIQGFSPLKTSVAFVLLQGMCLLQMPITHRILERYNPKWALGVGALLIGIGDLWMSGTTASDFSLAPIIAPLIVIGIGFGFAVSAVTAVAVNTVPNHLAGMASGSTSLLRDFGFTLGPAVIGAIALSRAATEIHDKVAANATLQHALSTFNASAAHAPAAQKASVQEAVGAVTSGPLGANAVPAHVTLPDGKSVPFNPLKDVAFHALDSAYNLGYVVCAVAALVAAALALFALHGGTHETLMNKESLA
jgi:MFS family permease